MSFFGLFEDMAVLRRSPFSRLPGCAASATGKLDLGKIILLTIACVDEAIWFQQNHMRCKQILAHLQRWRSLDGFEGFSLGGSTSPAAKALLEDKEVVPISDSDHEENFQTSTNRARRAPSRFGVLATQGELYEYLGSEEEEEPPRRRRSKRVEGGDFVPSLNPDDTDNENDRELRRDIAKLLCLL